MSINIGIRHLRAVIAVADHGTYTAAAQALGVAQSSLSRAVIEAERRVGVRLFERTTRRVEPTVDGRELVEVARRLVAEFDATLAHVEGYVAGTRGAVSVAALPSIAATLLPPVLAAFRRPRPDVSVVVRDGLSGEVLSMLVHGEVDLGLTVARELPPELVARTVAEDGFAVAVPEGHELAEAAEVPWSTLDGRPLVAFDRTSSIRGHTDAAYARVGIRPGPLTEARNVGAVAGLAGGGLGVAVVPGLVLPLVAFAGLVWRPLVEPVVRREVRLVRHRDRPLSRTARELMAALARASTGEVVLPPLVSWSDPADPAETATAPSR